MRKRYLQQNIYQALLKRLHFTFHEFDAVYVSLSGGKNNRLLLNILSDFRNKFYPSTSIGVSHQDFKAQYRVTTECVEEASEMLEKRSGVELYWPRLPMITRTALSSFEIYWYPWDDKKGTLWVRPMPEYDYIINLKSNPATTYHRKMHQEDLTKQFNRWYSSVHDNRRTVCLLGLRADESMQHCGDFVSREYSYKGKCWIT